MDGIMKEEAKIENNEIKEETPEKILPSHTVKDIFNLGKQEERVKIEITETEGRA